MRNKETISRLLKAYYAGETNLNEEKQLMDYFVHTTDVPSAWQDDQKLFCTLDQMANSEALSHSFDQKIEDWIETEIATEQEKVRPTKHSRQGWYYWVGAAAASLLLFVGIQTFVSTSHNGSSSQVAQQIELEPQEAAKLTKDVLLAFSTTLNQGVDGIKEADKQLEKVNHRIKQITRRK